ncbi:MAG: lyase family protein [Armatimonadota bacterium]|jgi:argininosuccinate lyase
MEMTPEQYWSSHEHRRHTPGVPEAPEWGHYRTLPARRVKETGNRLRFCALMDKAWLVMLHRKGHVSDEDVRRLFPVLAEADAEHGWGGEDWIRAKLGGDEATAFAVNHGRTLQEPMARMMMREALLYAFDELLPALETTLDLADEHADVLMAGHSHWAHAQPTTWGAYLLAVHDGLSRGLEQLELAYRHTNMNSGGCGACSGARWDVDRELITDLLGFDETIEPAYDCEASQDEMLTIMFAASNIAVTLSRVTLDLNVWVTEEWDIFEVDMAWRGVSSFMPHKANAGNLFEHVRMASNDVLGRMQTVLLSFKNEPLQDILPVYKADAYVLEGLAHLERCLGIFRGVLPNARPRGARMWELVREGYSGSVDLAIRIVKERGFGGRSAHRICCTMVRIARERGIKPWECTGALLDEAARISGDPEPNLSDEAVQYDMCLEHFHESPCNLGDPKPEETRRLVAKRRGALQDARGRQQGRRDRISAAMERLQAEIDAIMEATG